MELPDDVREQFQELGAAGGRARARRLTAARRRGIARLAALSRWTRERFGAPAFAELGLPGAEVVDRGRADLAMGQESLEALLVAIAAARLRREGVPLPDASLPDPEMRCYRRLEEAHGAMAHSRYNALLDQIRSFADACHLVRRRGRSRAK